MSVSHSTLRFFALLAGHSVTQNSVEWRVGGPWAHRVVLSAARHSMTQNCVKNAHGGPKLKSKSKQRTE